MRRAAFTGQFRRDYRRLRKRGWDLEHLLRVMDRLTAGESLEPRYATHPLRGGFSGHWECHIESDFLLIWYMADAEEIVFVRAGSHSDLFG